VKALLQIKDMILFTQYKTTCLTLSTAPVSLPYLPNKGVRKGVVGVNLPLELDILQKLYYLHKED